MNLLTITAVVLIFAILAGVPDDVYAHGGTPSSWHGTRFDVHVTANAHRGGAHYKARVFGRCSANWEPGWESPLIVHKAWHGMTQNPWHE